MTACYYYYYYHYYFVYFVRLVTSCNSLGEPSCPDPFQASAQLTRSDQIMLRFNTIQRSCDK